MAVEDDTECDSFCVATVTPWNPASAAGTSSSTTSRSSSNMAACHASLPEGETTIEPPSKTSSSCPPTAFT